MATLATRDFEEGTQGATVGDLNGIEYNAGGVTYDTAVAAHGSKSAYTPNNNYGILTYDVTGMTSWRVRSYFYRGTDTQTGHHWLFDVHDGSGYVADLQIRNELGGRLRNRWDFNTDYEQAASAMPTETWLRIDWNYTQSSTLEAIVYTAADDTVEDYTLTVTSTAAALVWLRFGVITTGGIATHYDSIAITDGTDPGSAAPAEAPSGSLRLPSVPTVPSIPSL